MGARVTGLDASRAIEGSSRERLYAAWMQYGILVFPELGMDVEQQLNVSRCFGRLEQHPVKHFVTEDAHRRSWC